MNFNGFHFNVHAPCWVRTKFGCPCACRNVTRKRYYRENETLRNVWRLYFQALISLPLRVFRLSNVLSPFSDKCAPDERLRNIFLFLPGVAATSSRFLIRCLIADLVIEGQLF